MAGEISWKLPWRNLEELAVRVAAEQLARDMDSVTSEVERDDHDSVSCFFHVSDGEENYTVEVSFYDLGGSDIVMSVEEEWSDNAEAWDAACDMAERLAEKLDAAELELNDD